MAIDSVIRQEIRANAEFVASVISSELGKEAGYGTDGMAWLDAFIQTQHESGDHHLYDQIVSTYGSYLGECIIDNIGGEWAIIDGAEAIEFDHNQHTFPFSGIRKHLVNGNAAGDSVLAYYQAAHALFSQLAAAKRDHQNRQERSDAIVDRLRDRAETVRALAAQQAGPQVGYNYLGIKWLDGHLQRLHGRGNVVESRRQAPALGAYLGECLIHVLGGKWLQLENGWSIVFDDHHQVFPFNKIVKQLNHGAADSVIRFYFDIVRACHCVPEPCRQLQALLAQQNGYVAYLGVPVHDPVGWRAIRSITPAEIITDDGTVYPAGFVTAFYVADAAGNLVVVDGASLPLSLLLPQHTASVADGRAEKPAAIGQETAVAIPIEQLHQLCEAAELTRSIIQENAQITLHYDRDSVHWLAGYIDRMRVNTPPEDWSCMTNVMGAFLGECIIRNIGGEWALHHHVACVRFDDQHAVFPFTTVIGQFEHGSAAGDSILGTYDSTLAMQSLSIPLVTAG
jgi:hypothetical protein